MKLVPARFSIYLLEIVLFLFVSFGSISIYPFIKPFFEKSSQWSPFIYYVNAPGIVLCIRILGIFCLARIFNHPFKKIFGTTVKVQSKLVVVMSFHLLMVITFSYALRLWSGVEWNFRWIWSWPSPGGIILGTVLQAFEEEWMCRGYVFSRVARLSQWKKVVWGLPINTAIIVNAVIFSLLHLFGGPQVILWVFVGGILFGIQRELSGSILFPTLTHTLANLWYWHLLEPGWLQW